MASRSDRALRVARLKRLRPTAAGDELVSSAPLSTAQREVIELQRMVGNREAQQILQRNPYGDAAKTASSDANATQAAQNAIEASYKPIREELQLRINKYRHMTVRQIVVKLRQDIKEAGKLSDLEISRLIQTWATDNGFILPPIPHVPGFGESPSGDGRKSLIEKLPPSQGMIKLTIPASFKTTSDGQPLFTPAEIKVPVGDKLTFKLTPGDGAGAIEAEVELHPEIKKALQVGSSEITLKLSSELTTKLDLQTRKLTSEAASKGKIEIKLFDAPIVLYGSVEGKVNFDYGERKVEKPEIKPQVGLEWKFDFP